MKRITTELHLEGSIIRSTIASLRELLENDQVFSSRPKIGSKEYTREAVLRIPDPHPLIQPARGLAHNLVLIIGFDQKIEDCETLEILFRQAGLYADAIDRVCKNALEEASAKYSNVKRSDLSAISQSHISHLRRNNPGMHRLRLLGHSGHRQRA